MQSAAGPSILCLVYTVCYVNSLADGDMRLAGFESSRLAGRVDIHLFGTWFTICNDQFTLREAAVVCRQLGLGYPVRLFNEDTDGPVKVTGSTSDPAVSRSVVYSVCPSSDALVTLLNFPWC